MLELNKIYLMDCIEGMKLIDDKFIDLTVTSPPYDNLRTYGNISTWNFDLFTKVASELFRITKDGGVVVCVVGDKTDKGSETGSSFRQALYFKDIGFNLHDTMIYAKNNPIPLTHNRYEQQFEYMFIFSKGKPKTFNPLLEKCKTAGKNQNQRTFWQTSNDTERKPAHKLELVKETKYRYNIWYYSVGVVKGKKHPAPFPDHLANDHILSWSNEKDIILDPFVGSATTAKVSKLLNRNFIGFENNENYYKIACNHIGQI
jgi:site-specific DNA-methyltransferase (adenine-specific)